MTTNTTRSGVLGGPPGSLMAWCFDLRLSASLHRVMELHCQKADPEDGCHWRGEAYIAHWTSMTDRNVRLVNRELEALGLLKVWPSFGRSNVYQVQCPQLGKPNDCSRVEAMLGRELGAPRPAPEKSRRKSRTPEKTSAPEPRNDIPPTPEESRTDTPEKSGTEPRNGFPPSSTSSSPIEQQDPQESAASPTATPAAAPDGATAPAPLPGPTPSLDYNLIMRQWNETAAQCGRPLVASLSRERRAKVKSRWSGSAWDWPAILAKVPEARGAAGWLTFDWLIANDTNFRKLLEGNYDQEFGGNGGRPGAPPPRATDSGTAAPGDEVRD